MLRKLPFVLVAASALGRPHFRRLKAFSVGASHRVCSKLHTRRGRRPVLAARISSDRVFAP
jgi:hypothetical protein